MSEKMLDELARAERIEYFKKWRAANKDKVKKHNANYWRKKAEQRLKEAATNDRPACDADYKRSKE